ncbi:MAG: class I SAM-dependent methyltransferase [Candidatus Zixiibacteriota bacterium]
MLGDVEQKKQYFNTYWQTRDITSADVRSIQRAVVIESMLNPDKGEKIIDVGCGRGIVLRHLVSKGFRASGCDISSDTVGELTQRDYDVFLCDVEKEDLPSKYDVILCLEVLQQVFDPIAIIQKFKQSLYRGGYLIISVPNEYHLLSRMKLMFGMSHLGHFEESHIRLFNPERAREMFTKCGLRIEAVISIPVIPPRIKPLQTTGNILACRMPGLFSLSQIYKLKVQ